MVRQVLQRMGGRIPPTYLVLDGHIGTNVARQMTQQGDLQLISKLRTDVVALYLPYAGRGPRLSGYHWFIPHMRSAQEETIKLLPEPPEPVLLECITGLVVILKENATVEAPTGATVLTGFDEDEIQQVVRNAVIDVKRLHRGLPESCPRNMGGQLQWQ